MFTDWMMARRAEVDYSNRVADDFDVWLAAWTWTWKVRALELALDHNTERLNSIKLRSENPSSLLFDLRSKTKQLHPKELRGHPYPQGTRTSSPSLSRYPHPLKTLQSPFLHRYRRPSLSPLPPPPPPPLLHPRHRPHPCHLLSRPPPLLLMLRTFPLRPFSKMSSSRFASPRREDMEPLQSKTSQRMWWL